MRKFGIFPSSTGYRERRARNFEYEEICGKYEEICRKYEEMWRNMEEIWRKYAGKWRNKGIYYTPPYMDRRTYKNSAGFRGYLRGNRWNMSQVGESVCVCARVRVCARERDIFRYVVERIMFKVRNWGIEKRRRREGACSWCSLPGMLCKYIV